MTGCYSKRKHIDTVRNYEQDMLREFPLAIERQILAHPVYREAKEYKGCEFTSTKLYAINSTSLKTKIGRTISKKYGNQRGSVESVVQKFQGIAKWSYELTKGSR